MEATATMLHIITKFEPCDPLEYQNQLRSVLRISKDDGGHANRGWKSEDEKLSCGYSSFREKRASLEGFYDVKISMVDGLVRLMEGDNTGPINIGNPGYYTNPLSHNNRDYGA